MRYKFILTNEQKGTLALTNEPRGWEDIVSIIKRSPLYHGIFYEFEDRKLDFYCEGHDFILDVIENQGIDAEVGILIQYACDCGETEEFFDYSDDYSGDYGGTSIPDCNWQDFFNAQIELKSYQTSGFEKERYVSVKVIQSGDIQTFLNRMAVSVDLSSTKSVDNIDLPVMNPYDLNLHSKVIIKRSRAMVDPAFNSYSFTHTFASQHWVRFRMPFVTDWDELGGITTVSPLFDYNPTSVAIPEPPPDFTFFEAGTIQVDYRIKCTLTHFSDGTMQESGSGISLQRRYPTYAGSDNTMLSTVDLAGFPAGTTTKEYDVSGSLTLNPFSEAKLFFQILLLNFRNSNSDNPWPSTFTLTLHPESFINYTQTTVFPATTTKAYAIHEAFDRVTQHILGRQNAFYSSLLGRTSLGYPSNGCGALNAITNGFSIRNFPHSERPIRISMKDLYNSVDAIYNTGIGYENNMVVLQRKEYFYDKGTILFRLDNVPNITRQEAVEKYYNTIDIAYEKWENEEVNGLDEFNTRRQFVVPFKNIEKALSLTSKLIASGYAIEFTRRQQYIDTRTKDYKYDNDNFIIALNRNNLSIAEKNENFTNVNNIISPETAYNLRLSPSRNLLRWSNLIKATLLKTPEKIVKFTYGEGNYELSSLDTIACPGNNDNIVLIEKSDVAFNRMLDAIWVPEIIKFQFPISFEQFLAVKEYPKGVIEVSNTEEGHVKYFIEELKYSPKNGLTDFTLLRAE
jgi:hypothetical protein